MTVGELLENYELVDEGPIQINGIRCDNSDRLAQHTDGFASGKVLRGTFSPVIMVLSITAEQEE